MQVIKVQYNSRDVGALSYDDKKKVGFFEYAASFINTGIELSPIKMPLKRNIYSFPNLEEYAFKGLPGLVADSLPDDFGNAVLNAWVAMQGSGRNPDSITPIERLQYTGTRGMGALTYHPATKVKKLSASQTIEIDSLVKIAQQIVDGRSNFEVELKPNDEDDKEGMLALLSVGMSAGGARPKAVLAFNKDFTKVRSGQATIPDGFRHYLMKFDGVSEHNKNKETFGDPMGYGAMEYTYHQMAVKAGVDMTECHLLKEGMRRHFITKRFDRDWNKRIHVQTLNAMDHVSFRKPGTYSYAELFGLARRLGLSRDEAKQLFKRMVFNVVARNHDDHSKNFAFMMDDNGNWSLAPAYDIAYSYKPKSEWVNSHWMTINGKRDGFVRDDFYQFEKVSPVFNKEFIDNTINHTIEVVSQWANMAQTNNVPLTLIELIESNLRIEL